MRTLVAIAYYGTNNESLLRRVLDEYESMGPDVDVVVLTEAPKDLPDGVEQRIGLPIPDPYSLPCAYKDLFVERADAYDLYIYSEDDTLISRAAIDTFLWATDVLPPTRIAGFLRTEETADGSVRCSSVHNHFHWDPGSAFEAGGEVWGHFTNPHGAAFMLTRSQLRSAIDSGGLMRPPHEGRFSMRVTAATDPYTNCGWEKVICLSRLDDFMLPHLSNRYHDTLGLSLDDFRAQADALRGTLDGSVDTRRLVDTTTKLDDNRWDKRYYTDVDRRAIDAVPAGARTVLSLGVGSGAAEAKLVARGHEVVGIPLDDIIAVTARRHGIELTCPDLDDAVDALTGRRFDAVVAYRSLQHFADPAAVLRRLETLMAPGGVVVATIPNLRRPKLRAALGRDADPVPSGGFDSLGAHIVDPPDAEEWFRAAGMGSVRRSYTTARRDHGLRAIDGDDVIISGVSRTRSRADAARPRVSIGLPVFDGERFLPEALDSIRFQSTDDFELVICDNASSDATEEICRTAAAADSRISYHRQTENRGAAFNYNDCFRRSRGEFFTWIAHDDLRAPDFLRRCLEVFDDGPESLVLVYPRAEFIDTDGAPLRRDRFSVETTATTPHQRLRTVVTDGGAMNSIFGLIRSSALARTRRIGAFRASDRVLLAELALLGEIREVPEILSFRRLHSDMSTEANPDPSSITRWFDPAARAPRMGRTQHLVVEYSRSVTRVPLTRAERLACLATVPSAIGIQVTRNVVGRWRRELIEKLESA